MSSTVQESPPETVLRIYLRAVMLLFPALLAWAFSTVYLLPKLTMLWTGAAAAGPEAQGLFEFATALITHFKVALFTVCVVLVLLEKYQPAFPRFRRAAVDSVTYTLNAAVIIALALLAVLAIGIAGSGKSAPPAAATAPPPAAVTP